MIETIKSCPFCGGAGVVCRSLGRFYIGCAGGGSESSCDVQGPTDTDCGRAIRKWNHRPDPPSPE